MQESFNERASEKAAGMVLTCIVLCTLTFVSGAGTESTSHRHLFSLADGLPPQPPRPQTPSKAPAEKPRRPPAPIDPEKTAMIQRLSAEVRRNAASIISSGAGGLKNKRSSHAGIDSSRLERLIESLESQDTRIQVLMEVAEEQKAVSSINCQG